MIGRRPSGQPSPHQGTWYRIFPPLPSSLSSLKAGNSCPAACLLSLSSGPKCSRIQEILSVSPSNSPKNPLISPDSGLSSSAARMMTLFSNPGNRPDSCRRISSDKNALPSLSRRRLSFTRSWHRKNRPPGLSVSPSSHTLSGKCLPPPRQSLLR